MADTNLLNDESVLEELGQRLARRRLQEGLTQAALATQAGVSKRTVERLEAGASTQLSNLVRILRVLGLQNDLLALVPEAGPSPMDLLRLKGKQRKRVRSPKKQPESGWDWGDEA